MAQATDRPVASVPMPEAVARLPRDPRGYPIFVSCQRQDEHGVMTGYSFQSVNGKTVARLIQQGRCGVCGEKLGSWFVFCGGPASVESGEFTDPPMHRECAEYAARVCPYIQRGGFDRTKLERLQEASLIASNPELFLGKPASQWLYEARSCAPRWAGTDKAGHLYFKAARPPRRLVEVGPGSPFQLGLSYEDARGLILATLLGRPIREELPDGKVSYRFEMTGGVTRGESKEGGEAGGAGEVDGAGGY